MKTSIYQGFSMAMLNDQMVKEAHSGGYVEPRMFGLQCVVESVHQF